MAKLENQTDSENSGHYDLDPHSDASARERNRLVCSTGIGMNKNYSSNESGREEESPKGNPDLEGDFMEFLLGISEDSPFYDGNRDIQDACETYGAEGKSTFFESKPLDSSVHCKIEPLVPTKPEVRASLAELVPEIMVPENEFQIDCKNFCIVCGQVRKTTCLDTKHPGLEETKFDFPIRPRFNDLCHEVEVKLFAKAVRPPWDAPSWFKALSAAYQSRQDLAGIPRFRTSGGDVPILTSPKPELEKQWRGEIQIALYPKEIQVSPPMVVDRESSTQPEELIAFPCTGGKANGSFRKTIKPWPEAEDYLQASVMLKEFELAEGPNPWTDVRGRRSPKKTRLVVSNSNPTVFRAERSVRFQDRIRDLGTLD